MTKPKCFIDSYAFFKSFMSTTVPALVTVSHPNPPLASSDLAPLRLFSHPIQLLNPSLKDDPAPLSRTFLSSPCRDGPAQPSSCTSGSVGRCRIVRL